MLSSSKIYGGNLEVMEMVGRSCVSELGAFSMCIIDMRGFKFAVGPRLGVTISRHRPWSEFPWHFSMFLPEAFTTSEKRRKDRDSIRYLYSKSYSR
jgi:hypothetical protein